MATGTTNPPGSDDPRDLRANAENLDLLITGPALNYPDRLGVSRRSWAGIDASYQAAESQREAAFQDQLANTGYELPSVPYAAGILIERETQLIERLGEFYRAKPGVVPFTTTGTWATDELNLVSVGDAALRQELASPTGSGMVYDQQADGTTFPRPIKGKLDALASVKDYGPPGTGNGVTSDHLAAVAMGAALGYIHFSRGNYVLDTCTLSYPISFDRKANVTVNLGQTVDINNTIDSPRQYIFKGAGVYNLGHSHVSDTGENARQIHVSWFGAFPNPDAGPDQAPFIQKAMTAMGNGRESEINFDIGNYNVSSPIVTTRGAHVRGRGQRRTVFKTDTDGFALFTTGGIACRFSGFGFELHGSLPTRNSPYLDIAHEACDVYDISLGQTHSGLEINGLNARAWNILAGYGSSPGPGSSVISINADGATVRDVFCPTSSGFGPESVVRIGTKTSGNISNILVENIQSIMPSKLVKIDATLGSVSNFTLSRLRYSGFQSTAPDVVHALTGGANSIRGAVLDDIYFTTYAATGVKLDQIGSGTITDVEIDSLVCSGSGSGTGVLFSEGAGVLSNVTVGGNVNVRGLATPFGYVGTPINIQIDPLALPEALPAVCYDRSIVDDGVAVIDLHRSVFAGALLVNAGSANYALLSIRAAATPSVVAMSISANVATAITALTGTTGTDGRLTIGVTNGILYIENRLGSTQRVSVSLLTGVNV